MRWHTDRRVQGGVLLIVVALLIYLAFWLLSGPGEAPSDAPPLPPSSEVS